MNGEQISIGQDRSRRSSTSSQKQMKRQNSGLSGLFSVNPKLPSKRPSPMGTPSTSLAQIPNNVPAQKNPQAQKRNNKGLSSLFGSSSTGPSDRNSNKGMRKSTSFPISRPLEAPPQPPIANNTSSRNIQDKNTSPESSEKREEIHGTPQNDLISSLYSSPNKENHKDNTKSIETPTDDTTKLENILRQKSQKNT